MENIAVIGAGKMGRILAESFLRAGLVTKEQVQGTVQHPNKAQELSRTLGLKIGTDNREAARAASVIIVCVKPQTVAKVLEEMAPELNGSKLVLSIAASVPTNYMEARVPAGVPVIRAMPNTPAQVGCGVTAMCKGKNAQNCHLELAQKLFQSTGAVEAVDEGQMDAITGLSASGPAYIYIILESLAEAGVKLGLPRELATRLAVQTTLGAAQVALDSGQHPALLKDAVTTPAGCTIDGILELEEGGLRVTLIKAVIKAARRASELLIR